MEGKSKVEELGYSDVEEVKQFYVRVFKCKTKDGYSRYVALVRYYEDSYFIVDRWLNELAHNVGHVLLAATNFLHHPGEGE